MAHVKKMILFQNYAAKIKKRNGKTQNEKKVEKIEREREA